MQLETELRLGLPGDRTNKRPFSDVGWPPVRSLKRKYKSTRMLVKVSMDGVLFLRKICLGDHKGYDDLVMALEHLFGCFFTMGRGFNEEDNCEHVPIYEDKDGDWMLLGDVPWEMFMESCKRLRIMRKSEAKCIGIQGRELGLDLVSPEEEIGASN